MTFIPVLWMLTGCSLLAATAIAIIKAGPGFYTPQAAIFGLTAVAMAVMAAGVGRLLTERRWVMAGVFVVCLLCAEALGLFLTTDRLIVAREEAQKEQRQTMLKRTRLVEDVEALKKKLRKLDQSPRLHQALENQNRVAATISNKAAERGCAKNCKALLSQQSEDARKEVKAARSELNRKRKNLNEQLSAASAKLAILPNNPEQYGLAGAIGWDQLSINLLFAILGSIAANGSGCALIAAAAHAPRRTKSTSSTALYDVSKAREHNTAALTDLDKQDVDVEIVSTNPLKLGEVKNRFPPQIECASKQQIIGCVSQFVSDRTYKNRRRQFGLVEAYSAYTTWCTSEKRDPITFEQFATKLNQELMCYDFVTSEIQDNDILIFGMGLRRAA